MEAAAVAAYQAQQEFPVVELLLCDDADQFKRLTAELAGCWVHDGRHYKKLMPVVPRHREQLADFLGDYWDFYDGLLAYQQAPTPEGAAQRTREFD